MEVRALANSVRRVSVEAIVATVLAVILVAWLAFRDEPRIPPPPTASQSTAG